MAKKTISKDLIIEMLQDTIEHYERMSKYSEEMFDTYNNLTELGAYAAYKGAKVQLETLIKIIREGD